MFKHPLNYKNKLKLRNFGESFKKYYEPYEELCTFNGGRLNSCRVWFAIKKDVDKIKREEKRMIKGNRY